MPSPAPHTPIDTAPLLRVVAMFTALAVSVLGGAGEGGLDRRAAARGQRYLGEMRRALRELSRVACFNRQLSALARLRRDAEFRAQLRLELGGYWVIYRWQRRLRVQQRRVEQSKRKAQIKAQIRAKSAAPKLARRAPLFQTPAKALTHPRTAMAGLYRLAPVPRVITHGRRAPEWVAPPAPRAPHSQRLAPVPLLPGDVKLDEMRARARQNL